jgi:uncharacterized damage-inducible protein DinB
MDFQKELIAEFDREADATRQMLEAIPADADFNYKPHEKSMPLGRLAGHISELGGQWAMAILTQDKMEIFPDKPHTPYSVTGKDAMLKRFAEETAATRKVLAEYTPAKWDGIWKFVMGGHVLVDENKYLAYRYWVMNHIIHHRAQLSVYLRMMNKPIPGTYGPSADSQK